MTYLLQQLIVLLAWAWWLIFGVMPGMEWLT